MSSGNVKIPDPLHVDTSDLKTRKQGQFGSKVKLYRIFFSAYSLLQLNALLWETKT